jgi:hypothetical protein
MHLPFYQNTRHRIPEVFNHKIRRLKTSNLSYQYILFDIGLHSLDRCLDSLAPIRILYIHPLENIQLEKYNCLLIVRS